jgi:CBS-domain-containing membrane protein
MTERHPRSAPCSARDLMKEPRALIPLGMSVESAAAVLESADVDAIPVVDSDGRCVGLFSTGDYRRWATRPGGTADIVCDWQIAAPATAPDDVRYHMTGRFAAATPSAQVPELLRRLREAPEPFLVVLDGQRRPMGIVCALDVLVAASESNGSRAKGSLLTAN